MKYFGLNRMDILQREGKYPLPPGASTILGVEFSGHIAVVGQGVTQWKEGDEVFGLASGVRLVKGPFHPLVSHPCSPPQGAYAEFMTVPERNVLKKPSHLSWGEAASIPENFLTGTQSFHRIRRQISHPTRLTAFQALVVIAEVKKGDNVLIHAGASGVGVAAIQLARLYGAYARSPSFPCIH